MPSEGTKALIKEVRRNKYMQPDETTWNDTLTRVAGALGTDYDHKKELFFLMEDGILVPAGRILAGAGTPHDVTLINCYVMNTIKDSLMGEYGIMDTLSRSARTMQMGGGIGIDFSPIRPKGALVRGVNAPASGILPFMDMWNTMCATIMSAGSRRGAMMATLRDDHPDLPDFIKAKQTPGRLTNFNISVLVSDAFIAAVKADASWKLQFNGEVYAEVSANALWHSIMESTYNYAEPGVIFIDRVNDGNPLKTIEKISCTNPCGEQPLPPNGACNLSAINLAKLVNDPFTVAASFDYEKLKLAVSATVEMLDNVLDKTKYPLIEQREEAMNKRRIGLGITGLGDMLILLGLRYDSPEARALTQQIFSVIANEADTKSRLLGQKRSTYKSKHDSVNTPTRRNGVLLTIAPTGTTSIAQGDNCSSGIEPVFAFTYNRKTLLPDGSFANHTVEDYAYSLWREKFGDRELPDYFLSASDLSPKDHLLMQAACQKYVDASISKTINCPEDISFADFESIYMQAYDLGCKGCTTYRHNPDSGRGAVLTTEKEVPQTKTPSPDMKAKRPEIIHGSTYKVKWPHSEEAYYITINFLPDGKPFEVFINSKNVKNAEWTAATTRLISALFRKFDDPSFIIEELTQVMSSDGGAYIKVPRGEKPQHVPSTVALIGYAIKDCLEQYGVMPLPCPATDAGRELCPECDTLNYAKESGCWICHNCGFSKC